MNIPSSKPELPLVLDNTQLTYFANCETKFLFAFLHKLTSPGQSIHLHAGGRFARALESIYTDVYAGMSRQQAMLKAQIEFFHKWGNVETPPTSGKTRDQVWYAVERYIEHFNPPHDYIEPSSAVEKPFEYTFAVPLDEEHFGVPFPLHPSGEPFIYAGRFDMVGQQFGAMRIRDDKTASGIGPAWEKQFTLRSQFIGYVAAMQALGFSVDTVEVRGVAILKTDVKLGAGCTVVKTYTDSQVQDWIATTAKRLRLLIETYESWDWTKDLGDACSSYSGCEFIDLCRTADPEPWFSTYTKRDWNPLLPTD